MNNKGLLLVVSGPAGSGKGTVLSKIMQDGDCAYSVSATTRQPRPGETNGINYHFMTEDEFKKHVENGDFLEYTEYVGNYYGTLFSEIKGKTDQGINVILELEVQGAENVKRLYPESVLIWILPPNYTTLEQRLRGRGTETDEVIQKRLNTAVKELEKFPLYDYLIINETHRSEEAAKALREVINAERHKVNRTDGFVNEFMNNKI